MQLRKLVNENEQVNKLASDRDQQIRKLANENEQVKKLASDKDQQIRKLAYENERVKKLAKEKETSEIFLKIINNLNNHSLLESKNLV